MTQSELDKLIENHQHWLNKDCDGHEDMRACVVAQMFSGLYFREANLTGATFGRCFFIDCDMSGCNFSDSDCSNSVFRYADTSGCNLSRTYLACSVFDNCRLDEVVFKSATLRDARLLMCSGMGADFSYADIEGTWFHHISLPSARFSSATFNGYTEFEHCNLYNTIDIPYIPMACPSDGAFIGWKKCRSSLRFNPFDNPSEALVKLQIPADAKRSSANGRKCRCNKAKVLEITRIDDGERLTRAVSFHDCRFLYTVGEMVSVDDFNDDRFLECTKGIHFFMSREEALAYNSF